MPVPDSYNKLSMKKDIYDKYTRSGYFGDGRRFYSATNALLREIRNARELNAFNKLLSESIGFTMKLRNIPSSLSIFNYDSAYSTLSAIDTFLTDTSAMLALIEHHNKSDPYFREIDQKLFDISPNKPQDVIGLEDRFPETEPDSTPLDHILLLGNTIFYSNKAAKFIDSVERMLHSKLNIGSNSFSSIQIVDNFCYSPEVGKYISTYANSPYDTEALDSCLDEIIQGIKEGRFDPSLNELADNKKELKRIIDLRIAKQSLYNIKNLSVIQLVKKCNEWNSDVRRDFIETGEQRSFIKYSFNPKQYGIYFNIPYSNMPIGVHISDHLYIALISSLNRSDYEITTRPFKTPTTLLRYIDNRNTIKNIQTVYRRQKHFDGGKVDPYIRNLKRRIDDDMDL